MSTNISRTVKARRLDASETTVSSPSHRGLPETGPASTADANSTIPSRKMRHRGNPSRHRSASSGQVNGIHKVLEGRFSGKIHRPEIAVSFEIQYTFGGGVTNNCHGVCRCPQHAVES